MKRMPYLPLALASFFCATAGLTAQDTPEALAERQEFEDKIKTLNARLDMVVEANQAYQKRLETLTGELKRLGEEIDRVKNEANKDAIKRLEDAIQEVDRKRIADNEKIVAELAKLGKTLTLPPPSSNSQTKPPANGNTPPRPPATAEKGYEYSVKSGDTGGTILQFYRDQGIKITLRQLMEANPTINWNKLKIGQKIFVPIPEKK